MKNHIYTALAVASIFGSALFTSCAGGMSMSMGHKKECKEHCCTAKCPKCGAACCEKDCDGMHHRDKAGHRWTTHRS